MKRMLRRQFLLATGALLAAPFAANAQTSGKIYRIGYIQTAAPSEAAHVTKAFEEGLRELGYVEGKNIVIERRFAGGKVERLPELAAELVRLKPDVIVTGSNPVIAAVREATATIPLVMTGSRDPVGSGFIASLARPGGNITGVASDPSPEFFGKHVELLKEMMPRASRIAVLWNPAAPAADTYRKAAERAASKLGLAMLSAPIHGRDELDGTFATMARKRIEAIVVQGGPVLFTARAQVIQLATKHRLPGVFYAREFVELGGLASYGSSVADNFRRAAVYVDKILKGAKPGELPVEQPTRFELVINLKTAKSLGITIAQAVLVRADEVIE
ncbi:MAG: ABC transporter substrate-binding protein [Betaproteobacteria bacterium]|nr:MAG: ABC transporter substrate-binding protein [Betaproteobacteria bacterium]